MQPYSGSQGDTDGWTDMTKLIVAIREYAKAPKNVVQFYDKPTNAHLQICSITYYYFSATFSATPNIISVKIIIQKVL
jgi:hypothetical protein